VSQAAPLSRPVFDRPSAIIGGDTQAIIGGDTQAIIGGDRSKSKRPNAIIGGDTQAIIGGDTQAIIGGDTQAIIGGDTQAIIGGDTQAIIGGDTQAIIGGDTQAIIGGDTQAIIGGDTQAIIGGDTQAIIGGDTQAIIGGDTQAIIGGDRFTQFAAEVLVWGPLAAIDLEKESLIVLGQTFQAKGNRGELRKLQAILASGQQVLISVRGGLSRTGELQDTSIRAFAKPRLNGMDSFLITGRVSRIDSSRAILSIGGLQVDYSNMLSVGEIGIAQGDTIAVVGTQVGSAAVMTAEGLKVFNRDY
jgi:hypothetical protein